MAEEPIDTSFIKKLAKSAKKNRVKRVYYTHFFETKDLKETGLIQTKDKSIYDFVSLERTQNEWVRYYGFSNSNLYFELELVILSLYTDSGKPLEESRWRFAEVKFCLNNLKPHSGQHMYSYEYKTLIDYEKLRSDPSVSERTREKLYKIGSLSIEIVLPFSISRISFNGKLLRDGRDLVQSRFTMSTHPTSDKFDYRYRFSSKYLTESIIGSLEIDKNIDSKKAEEQLALMLENRLDQPMMFNMQFQSGDLPQVNAFFWGSKMRRLLNPYDNLLNNCNESTLETLCVWAESGCVIHLNRPVDHPNLLYGMIHSSFEYPSHIYQANCLVPGSDAESRIGTLKPFSNLEPNTRISIVSFKSRVYNIEVLSAIDDETKTGPLRVRLNHFDGWGIRNEFNFASKLRDVQKILWTFKISPMNCLTDPLVAENLLGGKGYSLVQMSKLISLNRRETFGYHPMDIKEANVKVPNGLVVSTQVYRLWLESDQNIKKIIEDLDMKRRSLTARTYIRNPLSKDYLPLVEHQKLLQEYCTEACTRLETFPISDKLKDHIYNELRSIFSDEDISNDNNSGKRFAIRSSAVGEDSLETSAAGQLKTILDAVGIQSIYRAIVSCWVSQFSFEAVVYKTQNGLAFNWPMGVVVQELIHCDYAGVAATCDPLSGNKDRLEITANPGLGEGVVAGRETETVHVNLSACTWDDSMECYVCNGFEKTISIERLNQGDSNHLDDFDIRSLTSLILWIGRASDFYQREIEWGITHEFIGEEKIHTIHLFQSRPLTNLDRLNPQELDFEFDVGLSGPLEIVSRANIGEVLPGCVAPLTSSYFIQLVPHLYVTKGEDKNFSFKPFASNSWGSHARVQTIILTDAHILTNFGSGSQKVNQEVLEVMAGVESDWMTDKDKFLRFMAEKHNPQSTHRPFSLFHHRINDLGLHDIKFLNYKRRAKNFHYSDDLKSIKEWIEQIEAITEGRSNLVYADIEASIECDIKKLFERIYKEPDPLIDAWRNHNEASLISMRFNQLCLEAMSGQPNEKNEPREHLANFSLLIRGGGKTESGDISFLLDNLVECLAKENRLETFKSLSNSQIYEFLTSLDPKDGKCPGLYQKFIEINGHRGFKEFDFGSPCWADDPSYVINNLKARVRCYSPNRSEEIRISREARETDESNRVEKILETIERRKFLIKNYLLPAAKRGVIRREESKSYVISMINIFRRAFNHLGALFCLIGILPDADLIKYLCIEEVDYIVDWVSSKRESDRSDISRLIYKARRRKQRTNVLDKIKFPQVSTSIMKLYEMIYEQTGDVKKLSSNGIIIEQDKIDDDKYQVKGLVSCAGLVTGRACVVESLAEMNQVEPGDILVTYSIDVSWTVYFFAISGIVTELGGIVSHGAVVAREYGIPTLCSATGACSKFKTGQTITLDANKGVCYLEAEQASQGSA